MFTVEIFGQVIKKGIFVLEHGLQRPGKLVHRFHRRLVQGLDDHRQATADLHGRFAIVMAHPDLLGSGLHQGLPQCKHLVGLPGSQQRFQIFPDNRIIRSVAVIIPVVPPTRFGADFQDLPLYTVYQRFGPTGLQLNLVGKGSGNFRKSMAQIADQLY